MKKKLIYSSALAALLSASTIAFAGAPEIIPIEDYFSGFYVGGTGSVHHVDFDSDTSASLNQNVTLPASFGLLPVGTPLVAGTFLSLNTDGSSVDGYGGVQGGFGWTFNHVWYLGIQGFGEFGQEKSTQTTNSTPVNTSLPPTNVTTGFSDIETVSTSTTTKISNDYGVAAKLGYVVAPKTLVYAKVGPVWAKQTVSTSTTGQDVYTSLNPCSFCNPTQTITTSTVSGSTSASSSKTGIIAGIGAEQFVYQDIVSLGIEYNYLSFPTINSTSGNFSLNQTVNTSGSVNNTINNASIPVTTTVSQNAGVDEFLVYINFYFGRNWLPGVAQG